MANPNIVNVGNIYGNTAYVTPNATTANTAWTYNGTTSLTGLTPAAGTVNRITSIIVANNTASAATATVAIGNNSTFGSATQLGYFANQISVPPNASLVVVDKATSFYVTENQSLGVYTGTANALSFTAVFEAIS